MTENYKVPEYITLHEAWIARLDYANQHKMTKFIFDFRGGKYLSEWVKFKWSDPILITEI